MGSTIMKDTTVDDNSGKEGSSEVKLASQDETGNSPSTSSGDIGEKTQDDSADIKSTKNADVYSGSVDSKAVKAKKAKSGSKKEKMKKLNKASVSNVSKASGSAKSPTDKKPRQPKKESKKFANSGLLEEFSSSDGNSTFNEGSADEAIVSPSPDEPSVDPPIADETDAPVETDTPAPTGVPAVETEEPTASTTLEVTDEPIETTQPTSEPAPETEEPTDAPTAEQIPETQQPTVAPVEVTEEPTAEPVQTDTPTIADFLIDETASPTIEATTATTESLTGADTASPTTGPEENVVPEAPTDAPGEENSTEAPTAIGGSVVSEAPTVSAKDLDCPTAVEFTGDWLYTFVFADREANEDEISALGNATFDYFTDLFTETYGEGSVEELSGTIMEIGENDFEEAPPTFSLTIAADVSFAECAPEIDDVNELLTLNSTQYETYLSDYVFTIEPAGQTIWVLVAQADFDGSASYVEE